MKIEILINPKAENYEKFKQGLEKEIGALEGIEYSRATVKAPENTLSVMHDVSRYVIEHPEVIKVLPYVIELVRTALDRWRVPSEKKEPPAVIIVDGRTLKMPTSTNSENKFIEAVREGKSNRRKDSPKPRSKRGPTSAKRKPKQKPKR
jgi:hypothetical protein